MDYMIHRFDTSLIFGDPEEYEEHSNIHSCMRRVKWLASQDDGYEYWAEDADGNIHNADEPCGYCGSSQNPDDICITCYDNLKGA